MSITKVISWFRWLKLKSFERRHRRLSTKIHDEAKPIDGFWTRNQNTCSLESEEMALPIDDKLDYMMDYVKIERLIKLSIETDKKSRAQFVVIELRNVYVSFCVLL